MLTLKYDPRVVNTNVGLNMKYSACNFMRLTIYPERGVPKVHGKITIGGAGRTAAETV